MWNRHQTLTAASAAVMITASLACGGSSTQSGADAGADAGWDAGETGDDTAREGDVRFLIPATGQNDCYDDQGVVITCPAEGERFFGQDAQSAGPDMRYQDHGDGTVTDLVTGLMWQAGLDDKLTFEETLAAADALVLAGYDDWRVPTITELYSLIDFRGVTGMSASGSVPYIDASVFVFEYGDESAGERFIDAQWWSSSVYESTTMAGDETVFGVNFADGRIKGYPVFVPRLGSGKLNFVRYVRGGDGYAQNDLVDQGDGTVLDRATGLIWTQDDSGGYAAGAFGDGTLDWEEAMAWCEGLDAAGHSDWRLPNAKELQGLVDYSRSPDTTDSAAIDPVFDVSVVVAEDGVDDYPFYWTSTSHLDGAQPGSYAVYVAFGEALGFMEMPPGSGNRQLLDVHGAGAQRSDPKSGDPNDFPEGHGPQGDVVRIYNHARCLRGAR